MATRAWATPVSPKSRSRRSVRDTTLSRRTNSPGVIDARVATGRKTSGTVVAAAPRGPGGRWASASGGGAERGDPEEAFQASRFVA